jgi:3-deoxy-D-arabino-heptulosonate 7-phosphate (DAHP) synthase class II
LLTAEIENQGRLAAMISISSNRIQELLPLRFEQVRSEYRQKVLQKLPADIGNLQV